MHKHMKLAFRYIKILIHLKVLLMVLNVLGGGNEKRDIIIID